MKFLKNDKQEIDKICNHDGSEEDTQLQYINEYKRYFKFLDKLK